MGSIHKYSCRCGFEQEVTFGGVRADQHSSLFPYYCENCGLVEVNTAVNPEYEPSCPKCMYPDIHAYVTSYQDVTGNLTVCSTDDGDRVAYTWDIYCMKVPGNLCPVCKDFTLMKSGPLILFESPRVSRRPVGLSHSVVAV